MAKMVEGKTQNPDIKKFAAQIIADQEKEISQMKDWREKWFAGKPAAMNVDMPGNDGFHEDGYGKAYKFERQRI